MEIRGRLRQRTPARFGCRSKLHSVVDNYYSVRQQADIAGSILGSDFNDMLGVRELRRIKNKMKCGIGRCTRIGHCNIRASDIRRPRGYQHIMYVQIDARSENAARSYDSRSPFGYLSSPEYLSSYLL